MVVIKAVTFAVLEDCAPIDVDKVARLKAAIARGEYRLDYDILASAIIGFGRTAGRQKFDVALPSKN